MPEITTITSESLQAEVRRLLPSQRGFGSDLEAQNVIVPIVDLTATAEGSALRADLQTAASLGNCTKTILNIPGTDVNQNTVGFYRYEAIMSVLSSGSALGNRVRIQLNNTSSLTTVDLHDLGNSSDGNPEEPQTVNVTGTVYLDQNDRLQVNVTGSDGFVTITSWPVADANGNFINPSGFSFE